LKSPYTLPLPYVFITKWGSPGSGDGQFDSPGDITIYNEGYIYVIDTNNKRLQKFDSDGNFMIKWALNTVNKKIRGYFYDSIAVDHKGYIFVGDTYNDCIEKFDSKGNFILKWGAEGERNGEFNSPVCIAVDNEGDIYVSDIWNDRIQKFNNKGEFITKLDFHENYYTFLIRPTGITVGRDGYIYLVDEGSWIRKFSSSGNLIKKWMYKTFNMTQSQQIVIDSVGYIYILSTYQTDPTIFFEPSGVVPSNMLDYYSIIQKYDPNGNFADIIKKSTSRGSLDGKLADRAWGMAIDSKDNIYVADTYNNRIQKFDSKGNFITKYGTKGNKEGEFNLPIGIAVNKKGEVYVVDSGNYRIQKFAPVP